MTKRSRTLLLVLFAGAMVVTGAIAVRRRYDRAVETQCRNHIKQIGLGLSNYHDSYSTFPSAREGGHSWRIRLLPYMWSSPQYSVYDFDQPWDSENNITIDVRPLPSKSGDLAVYGNPYGPPCDADDPHFTSYLLVVGDEAFAAPNRGRKQSEITDGLENTIAVAEVALSSVHWISPVDLDFETMSFSINDGPRSISSCHPSGPAVLFCDGAVYRLNSGIDPATVRGLCTINGGESISRDSLVSAGLLIP